MRAANGKAFQRKKNPWKEEQCAKKLRDFFRVDLPLDLRRWRKQIEQIQLAPPGGRSELLNDSTYQHSRACSWGQDCQVFAGVGMGWKGEAMQLSGKGWGGKKSDSNPSPALAQKGRVTCQSSKGFLTPRPEFSKQGSISCSAYLSAFLSQTFPAYLLCARCVLEVCNIAFNKKCAI